MQYQNKEKEQPEGDNKVMPLPLGKEFLHNKIIADGWVEMEIQEIREAYGL